MRIATECPFCSPSERRPIPLEIELSDDFYIQFVCDNVHENTRFIETERFSVLFDLGMFAMEDGYSREAVANFASSIERMYEFYIRVICKRHEMDGSMAASTWKLVANQSERQLGAFYFLFLLGTKTSPPAAPMVEFRNKVIHKGYIPSRAEALEYARKVHDYVGGIVSRLNREFAEFVSAVHSDERKKVTGDKHNSNMSVKQYIPFSTMHLRYYEISLDKKMEKAKSYRWLLPGSGPIQSREQINGLTGAALIVARQAGNLPLMTTDASDLEAE